MSDTSCRLDMDQAWTAACAYDAMRDDLEEDLGERPRITTVEDVLEGIAQSDAWIGERAGANRRRRFAAHSADL